MGDFKSFNLYISDPEQLWQVLLLANRVMFRRAHLLFPREITGQIRRGLEELVHAGSLAPVQITSFVMETGDRNRSPQSALLRTDARMDITGYSVLQCLAGAFCSRCRAGQEKLRAFSDWVWGMMETPRPFTDRMLAGIAANPETLSTLAVLTLGKWGLPTVMCRGEKLEEGKWVPWCWNEVYVDNRWIPADFTRRDPGDILSDRNRCREIFAQGYRTEENPQRTLWRDAYSQVGTGLEQLPIRGSHCFRFCSLGDLTIEVPVCLHSSRNGRQHWNLLWLTALLGGGYLPSDSQGNGFVVLGRQVTTVAYREEEQGCGDVSDETLAQLPLDFREEDGILDIHVRKEA